MINEDFLLKTRTSKKLFFDYAKDLPIYDYHCHLNPQEIAEDKKFKNITELWLGGDHYKWRYMRCMGISEKYITGSASDFDKFKAYAKSIMYAAGNPLYHWSHLELQRYFEITDTINENNAEEIWNKANEKISDGFSAVKAIKISNVNLIATTDDPFDSLEYHRQIKNSGILSTRVVPTFRPDKAVNIENSGFAEYMAKNGIESYDTLLKKLSERLDCFMETGSRISDHSVEILPYMPSTQSDAKAVFDKVLSGHKADYSEICKYKTHILLYLAAEYKKRNFAMQLHLGALRNNNSKIFESLGADAGCDSMNSGTEIKNLSKFLNALDSRNILPKTIVYSLNPNDLYPLITMCGNFQSEGIRGKVQTGAAWWMNDHTDGISAQLKATANCGALAAAVGMLTDSRSFLSYTRHEYYRRILCNIVGEWVENGEFDNDSATLKTLIQDICFNNAKKYFNM